MSRAVIRENISPNYYFAGVIKGGSGESTRLPLMWPGFDSRSRLHTWVEFVVGSLLAPRGFLRYSGFPLSSKTNILNPIRCGKCPQLVLAC